MRKYLEYKCLFYLILYIYLKLLNLNQKAKALK